MAVVHGERYCLVEIVGPASSSCLVNKSDIQSHGVGARPRFRRCQQGNRRRPGRLRKCKHMAAAKLSLIRVRAAIRKHTISSKCMHARKAGT